MAHRINLFNSIITIVKTRILSIVTLLLMAATDAVAQTETLLTTITATGIEQASYSTANVATVSFSYTAEGSSAYLANWGWWGYGWSATVNAAEGYTITKCVFYDDANRTATDSEAPFVVETTEEDKTPKVNGTPIEEYTSKGIKKIDVYGYENPTTVAVTGVTLNQNEAQMTVGGETLTLTATVNPNNATDQSVSWSTSDANVATVENGVVTAVAAGNATITVTTTDGSFTATCAITVTAPEPEPAEVTVVFAANNKTVERTVTLPHTFKCSWDNGMDGPDELDIIIHELYNDYYYCNSNMNASGSDQVEVGTEEAPRNDYITIKGVFEGTATVTGDYFDWITGEEGEHNYSITISIKGDEPEPTGVENVQTNQVQGTKILRDGMLLIEKNGKIYNVMGAEVK